MFESCICIDISESCELLSRNRRKARKEHRCVECKCVIQPGDTYEVDVTLFEGDFTAYKTCLTCVRVRESLFECGWYYGRIWNDVHKAHCGEGICICP